jgi:hypothetical protein
VQATLALPIGMANLKPINPGISSLIVGISFTVDGTDLFPDLCASSEHINIFD